MKIGIDARMLGPKQGGIGRYVEQLIKQFKCHPERSEGSFEVSNKDSSVTSLPQNDKLVACHPERSEGSFLEFIIFLRKENWNLVDETPNIKKVLADIYWYGWREQLLLPGIIKKEKVDLMHFPHWNIPLFYIKPFIATIHDLLLLHYPTRASSTLGPVSYFFKNLAYKIILRHAIKKSKHILTPSEFTKNDILKNFKIKAKKITVTHLAPMPMDSRLPTGQANLLGNDNIIKNFGINKPYILYVGTAYPHKNLAGLIEAWKIFCHEHGNAYQLVLAGRKNYFYEQLECEVPCCHPERSEGSATLYEKDSSITVLPQNDTADNIVFTDYVPDKELPGLYQNAELYVFPSFYEGFGLPPLEAMQYGVPVVSSSATCLPEILKDAVLYFDPSNKKEISDAIWRGLTDEKLRQQLNQKSIQLIHNYSWKKTAKITLETYLNVI